MITIEFLRSFRVGPFAIFDFVASYLGMYLLSPILIYLFHLVGITLTKSQILWFTLPLSVFIHIAVGNYTPLTKQFLDVQGGWIVKIIVLFMIWKTVEPWVRK